MVSQKHGSGRGERERQAVSLSFVSSVSIAPVAKDSTPSSLPHPDYE
jgi:hypothetical protein